MQHILDLLFSDGLIATTLICVWMLFFTFLSFRKYAENKTLNYIAKGACSIAVLLPFIVMMITHTGFASAFDSVRAGKTTIILLEKYERGEDMESICRIHVLNKNTGEKLYREYLGHEAYFRETRGDTVLMEIEHGFKVIYATDFSVISDISKESLVKNFSELTGGVERIDDSDFRGQFCVLVHALNGKEYNYFPFTNQLKPKTTDQIYRQNTQHGLSFEHDKISFYLNGNQCKYLELKSSSDSKIKSLIFQDSINTDKSFLLGEFIDFDTLNQEVTIKTFTNTLQENFILTHLDKKQNIVWTYEQAKEKLKDYYSEKGELNVFLSDAENFYFNCGGFIVCLNKKSGKTKWVTRL